MPAAQLSISTTKTASDKTWKCPKHAQIFLITSDEDLATLDVGSESVVMAIDAEWPPEQTLSSSQPSATLLQLAFWSPTSGITVVLLDLLALSQLAVYEFVRPLLRDKNILKIGYAFKADILSISTALGTSYGPSCMVVNSALDLAYSDWAPNRRTSPSSGLAALVDICLGASLDKTMQCSAWGQRPLSSEQISYAAADACCLLYIVQSIMAEHGLLTSEDIDKIKKDAIVWTPEEIANVITAWAVRLDFSTGGGGYSASAAKKKHNKSQERKKKKNKSAVDDALIRPRCIPWQDSEGKLIGEPKFLADVMATGCARQLRLFGFDAEAVDAAPKTERHVVYRTLVERAAEEKRVILTRDTGFINRNLSDQAYFVLSCAKQEQVKEVIAAFWLPVDETALLSRCARCNGEFYPEPMSAEDVVRIEGHGLSERVLSRGHEFWVCSRCQAVFWQGSMYARAMENLSEALNKIKL